MLCGFTGSRNLNESYKPLVLNICQAMSKNSYILTVGCANGLDSFVRNSPHFNKTYLFSVSNYLSKAGSHKAALVERSKHMVEYVSKSKPNALIAWPDKPCPSSITPAKTWKSGKSGTWSTLALSIGFGIPSVVFICGNFQPPQWPHGQWVKVTITGWSNAYKWVAEEAPQPTQLKII